MTVHLSLFQMQDDLRVCSSTYSRAFSECSQVGHQKNWDRDSGIAPIFINLLTRIWSDPSTILLLNCPPSVSVYNFPGRLFGSLVGSHFDRPIEFCSLWGGQMATKMSLASQLHIQWHLVVPLYLWLSVLPKGSKGMFVTWQWNNLPQRWWMPCPLLVNWLWRKVVFFSFH